MYARWTLSRTLICIFRPILLLTCSSNLSAGNFLVTPSPLNRTIEQQEAVFHCQHPRSDYLSWRVNEIPFINVPTSPLEGGGLSSTLRLRIDDLDSNRTTVICVVGFYDGESGLEETQPVFLMIQGIPGEVKNPIHQRDYLSKSLTTSWDPVFSLDLTDIDPDIVYKVELFETTCGRNFPIHQWDVAENSVTEENLDLMQIYKVVITPRNNVHGARNGPSVEIEETFMSLNGYILSELARLSQVNIISLDPIPPHYTLILDSIDSTGQDLMINISVVRIGEMIKMTIEEVLRSKSLWIASVLPYGCPGADIARSEISTHDIQNITSVADTSVPGRIQVMATFVDGSTATGVLMIVYSMTVESDIQYIVKQTEQSVIRDNIIMVLLGVSGLSGTEYKVSVYALENGLPFPRAVTRPKSVVVATNSSDEENLMAQQPQVDYSIQANDINICISCTFLESTLTDCVAVVHQRISQLSSRGLMNIESSHKFTRSGNTAYGCIEGVNLEQNQVGVFGVKLIATHDFEPSYSSNVAIIVTLLIAALFLVLAVILAVLTVYIRFCRIHHNITPPMDGTLATICSDEPNPPLPPRVIVDCQPAPAPLHLQMVEDGEPTPPLHQVVSSEIQAQSQGEVTCSEPVSEQPCDAGTPPPRDCLLSADLLFLHLLPYASKWQSLGEALSLDDDRLDEIFTNNETEEACLREMIELYMMRSDLDHSWEEIESALKNSSIANEFKSEPNLPYSQGSETFDDHPQCTLTYNKENVTLAATGVQGTSISQTINM